MNNDEFITKIRELIARPYEPYQPSIESEITKLLAELDHPTAVSGMPVIQRGAQQR